MRYFILALSIALIINGCKKNSNPVASVTNPALSVSQVSDSMQYTFAIPRSVFGIHDTLSASFTAFNQSAEPDTLMIRIFSMVAEKRKWTNINGWTWTTLSSCNTFNNKFPSVKRDIWIIPSCHGYIGGADHCRLLYIARVISFIVIYS